MIEIGLRAPEPEDLEIMLAVENDPGLWEHSSENTGPYTRFQMKQYIAGNTNDIFTDRQLRLMITLTDGRIAGIVDVFDLFFVGSPPGFHLHDPQTGSSFTDNSSGFAARRPGLPPGADGGRCSVRYYRFWRSPARL